ncbi:MAG TPA: DinB family protein [Acidobacteriaceae bacterium]|nr:DinB family protein [Acidobacteriaceae bacterium]
MAQRVLGQEKVMRQNLDSSLALLARTPASLDALLRGLPDAWTLRNEGDGTWTVRDVVAHLADLERTDWMPRVQRLLDCGETRAFDPVDRQAFRRNARGKSMARLLGEFARRRQKNLRDLRTLKLTAPDFGRRGQHPSLGRVTLAELLAAWTVHDLTHLHQITRILAHQYRQATGPWERYLGVLQCNGHSASA